DTHIVDAMHGAHRFGRDGKCGSLAHGDGHQRALVDEIVADALNLDVGDHAPFVDFRIDLAAAAGTDCLELAGALHQSTLANDGLCALRDLGRMPFRQGKAQIIWPGCDTRDVLTCHDDGSEGYGDGEDPTRCGSKDFTFLRALLDNRLLRNRGSGRSEEHTSELQSRENLECR